MADVAHSTTSIVGGHANATQTTAGFVSSADKLVKLDGQIVAWAATTTTLPAYTYANGSSGVGATITANANGAFPTLDGGISLTANDAVKGVFLFHNGAATSDNGVYLLTTQGDAGTPWVATRHTAADTSTKVQQSRVKVLQGIQKSGAEYEYRAIATPTMGTTPLFWWRVDRRGSPNELNIVCEDDFNYGVANNATNGVCTGIWAQFNSGTGATSNISASVGTATQQGVMVCSTGTSSTGRGTVINNLQNAQFVFGTNMGFQMAIKLGLPTLSDGTNTFSVQVGFSDMVTAIPGAANNVCAVTFQPLVSGTDWQITTANGSAIANTGSGRTIVAGTDDHIIFRKDPGDNNLYTWVNGTALSAITSNFPTTNPMGLAIWILKSAGTTARTVNVDFLKCELYFPQGRAT